MRLSKKKIRTRSSKKIGEKTLSAKKVWDTHRCIQNFGEYTGYTHSENFEIHLRGMSAVGLAVGDEGLTDKTKKQLYFEVHTCSVQGGDKENWATKARTQAFCTGMLKEGWGCVVETHTWSRCCVTVITIALWPRELSGFMAVARTT